jgi:hypothetical protein
MAQHNLPNLTPTQCARHEQTLQQENAAQDTASRARLLLFSFSNRTATTTTPFILALVDRGTVEQQMTADAWARAGWDGGFSPNHHVLSHGTRGSHASCITRSLSYLTRCRGISPATRSIYGHPHPNLPRFPKGRFSGTRLCSTNRLGPSVTSGTKHRVPIRDGTRRQARHHQWGVISRPRTTRADWHNTGRLCRPDDFDDKRAALLPHQTDMYRHLYIVPTSPAPTLTTVSNRQPRRRRRRRGKVLSAASMQSCWLR